MRLRVLGITFTLYPKKPKKYNIRNYTKRKIARRERWAQFIETKKNEFFKLFKSDKKTESEQKPEQKSEKKESDGSIDTLKNLLKNLPSIPDSASLFLDTVKLFSSSFFSHFHFHVARIRISVGGEDAAQIGILYGAIVSAFDPIMCIIDRHSNLHGMKRADIDISPDFLSDRVKFDVKLGFSMSLAGFLAVLIKTSLHTIIGISNILPEGFWDAVFGLFGNDDSKKSDNAVKQNA